MDGKREIPSADALSLSLPLSLSLSLSLPLSLPLSLSLIEEPQSTVPHTHTSNNRTLLCRRLQLPPLEHDIGLNQEMEPISTSSCHFLSGWVTMVTPEGCMMGWNEVRVGRVPEVQSAIILYH